MKVTRFPRFFLGLGVGVLFSVTAAYAINVENTPETGYLLCVNSKTKAVTFPGVLKCPSGSKPLELGAQGAEGPMGVTGPTGATGQSADVKAMGNLVFGNFGPLDAALPSGSVSRRVILATLSDKNFDQKSGRYFLFVQISGSWVSYATAMSAGEISCKTQSLANYNAVPNNSYEPGVYDPGADRAHDDGNNNFKMLVTGTFTPGVDTTQVISCTAYKSVFGLSGTIWAMWFPASTNFLTPINQTLGN